MQEEHMKKGAIESAGIESGIAFAGRSKADAKKGLQINRAAIKTPRKARRHDFMKQPEGIRLRSL